MTLWVRNIAGLQNIPLASHLRKGGGRGRENLAEYLDFPRGWGIVSKDGESRE